MIINKFDSTKNYTALLLSLFDNIQLQKTDNTYYTIPIYFSNKSRLYKKLARTQVDKQYSIKIPAFSLELINWEPSYDRATSRFLKRKVVAFDAFKSTVTWNDTPINFNFKMTLLSKNLEELTNISEAIISIFKNNLYYIDYKTPIGDTISTPISLESADVNIDNNEAEYLDDRMLESEFTFKVEGVAHSQFNTLNGTVKTINFILERYNLSIDQIIEQYTII